MARPRVFISSTFYDLRQVRENIERTIRELAYEPVRNETGVVPYGRDERPESAAYREVELCDIIVSIIGGRFGTESKDEPGFSISQNELRRALERGIQVFIFVEKSVLAEYSTYELNKDNGDVRYRFVDDLRIFKFLEDVHKLPRNNPIAPFETAADISNYLKEQFAGLFHRFLQDQKRVVELKTLDEMRSIASTLENVVKYLIEERQQGNDAVKTIVVANHPAFARLASLTKTPYRVYFLNRDEFEAWLKSRGWTRSDEPPDGVVEEWDNTGLRATLSFHHDLFDRNGQLKVVYQSEWNDEWVSRTEWPPQTLPPADDIPF